MLIIRTLPGKFGASRALRGTHKTQSISLYKMYLNIKFQDMPRGFFFYKIQAHCSYVGQRQMQAHAYFIYHVQ